MTSRSIIHTDLHKPNNKLVNAQLQHFWCTNEPWANMDSQNSPRPGLRGSHHLPPYNIPCARPRGLNPNVILTRDSQLGSLEIPKIPKIGTPTTLEAHNFLCRHLIEMRSKAKLQLLSRAFERYATQHLHASKSGQFSNFSGRESNWQFDFQPFFWP